MVERAINDPVPFYWYKWANWACVLATLKTWDGLDTRLLVAGELSTSLQVEKVF